MPSGFGPISGQSIAALSGLGIGVNIDEAVVLTTADLASLNVTYSRTLSDANALSDSTSLDLTKGLSDSLSTSDSALRGVEYTRELLDTSIVQEAGLTAFVSSRILVELSDDQPVTESLLKQGWFQRDLLDTSASVDYLTRTFERLIAESASATDAKTLLFDRSFTDVLVGTEAFLFNPLLSDAQVVTDTTIRSALVELSFSDAISLTAAIDATKVQDVTMEQSAAVTDSIALRRYRTPLTRDVAGNPENIAFKDAVYKGDASILDRSIFVKKGPIARSPRILQSGSAGTILNTDSITLTGAALTSAVLGMSVVLSAGGNSGTYKITAILTTSSVRVSANFRLPYASITSWQVLDPRNGQVSDEPSDVTIRVNDEVLEADAVIGLLGQIVLPYIYPAYPDSGDDVKIDYRQIANPTVEIRRLNSKEFRLNAWNTDVGSVSGTSGHVYRFNNVLVTPSDYVVDSVQAALAEPEQRGLKYRAYERAYTPSLNDPTLLKLNAPSHKIAYPKLARDLKGTFVSYVATNLPEQDPLSPWRVEGQGSAEVSNNVLTVSDNSVSLDPKYWAREIDVSFDHIFAMTWRVSITMSSNDGVFSGVFAGYATPNGVLVLGYLNDNGVRKIGFLKRGVSPYLLTSWGGGIDAHGVPTGAPIAIDWSQTRAYRLFRARNGVLSLFIDGDVDAVLRVAETELPYLEELDAPFDALMGVFFGSISRPATSVSKWDFVRYDIQATNTSETTPSVYVSYEGTTDVELASQPWIPVGYAGVETVSDSLLLLDSTSSNGTDVQVGGSFRGYTRIEPLLGAASDIQLDFGVQLRSHTHSTEPHALMAAVDDGSKLAQLSFISDTSAPKKSYGGYVLPTALGWEEMGEQPAAMVGRFLRITDTSTTDGRLFFTSDTASITGPLRTVSPNNDYIVEARCRVLSYVADELGFAGFNFDVYDGYRSIGLYGQNDSGTKYVVLHTDGIIIERFEFNWDDGQFHTYRLVKNTDANLVSIQIDKALLGTIDYTDFDVPNVGPDGSLTFGSTTPVSFAAKSTVDWVYVNAWRVVSTENRYVGLWKGTTGSGLVDYHFPLRVESIGLLTGDTVIDNSIDFQAAGVLAGQHLLIDDGVNRGTYTVSIVTQHTLTLTTSFVSSPTTSSYRIPLTTDWTSQQRFRMKLGPTGLTILRGDALASFLRLDYSVLPLSNVGLPTRFNTGLPSVSFGSFDAKQLTQSAWDYVRYGATRVDNELKSSPHHQTLNQRNTVSSPEHLFTSLSHDHTNFFSSSTGVPPHTSPDFMEEEDVIAYTLLNDGTPLVPLTQTYEVRSPQVVTEPVSGLNRIEDVLNTDRDFLLNTGLVRKTLIVPDDVLYNSLQVIETKSGTPSLLTSGMDSPPQIGPLLFQKNVCMTYTSDQLPEVSSPPWNLVSDDATHVSKSIVTGKLTYGTDIEGTRTAYHNPTPLVDVVGMPTEVNFRVKINSDASYGEGDTLIRFGVNGLGLAVSLAFVTSPIGERYVLVVDQVTDNVLAGHRFDFLDDQYHSYRIVRNPASQAITVYVDPDPGHHYLRVRISDDNSTTDAISVDTNVILVDLTDALASVDSFATSSHPHSFSDDLDVIDSSDWKLFYGRTMFDTAVIADSVTADIDTTIYYPLFFFLI